MLCIKKTSYLTTGYLIINNKYLKKAYVEWFQIPERGYTIMEMYAEHAKMSKKTSRLDIFSLC